MVFGNGRDAVLNQEQQAELERLQKVLAVAQRNGNQLFIANIEREIAALERGDPEGWRTSPHSPLINDSPQPLLFTSPRPSVRDHDPVRRAQRRLAAAMIIGPRPAVLAQRQMSDCLRRL